jgi:hypothetical protein
MGGYLFHELTTPLGLRLEKCRRKLPATPATCFRSFGTYAIWFPRGLLLRLAARQACQHLVLDWMAEGEPTARTEVQAACARIFADPRLHPETLATCLADSAATLQAAQRVRANGTAPTLPDLRGDNALEGRPAEVLTAILSSLEEQSQQSVAQDDPGGWARQAVQRVRDWIGASGGSGDWRKSRLGRALAGAADQLALEWSEELVGAAHGLMEHPGRRAAAAEAALEQFLDFCNQATADLERRLQQQHLRTQQAQGYLDAALEACLAGAGGFSLFGNKARRLLRVFMDHLAAYARQRLAEEVMVSCGQFFAKLQGRLAEQIRDLTFCRQRLRHLRESLELPGEEAEESDPRFRRVESTISHSPVPSTESFWQAIRQSATAHVVLPEGEPDLEQAAARFLNTLHPSQWTNLDQALQDHVLGPLGGLHQACMRTGDLARNVARPLLDQAVSFLGELLPVTDVAQVELSRGAMQGETEQQVREYFDRAAPLLAGKDAEVQQNFLLAPASDAGKEFAAAARGAVPVLELVRVSGQAHLLFCREQGYLTPEDLQRLLRPCRTAYEHAALAPNLSPHARFDIVDWVPIDP